MRPVPAPLPAGLGCSNLQALNLSACCRIKEGLPPQALAIAVSRQAQQPYRAAAGPATATAAGAPAGARACVLPACPPTAWPQSCARCPALPWQSGRLAELRMADLAWMGPQVGGGGGGAGMHMPSAGMPAAPGPSTGSACSCG